MMYCKYFVLFLIFSVVEAKAQTPWAAPGATWYYTFDHFAYAQYIKIQKVNDTLINGFPCDVLQKTRIGYDYLQSTYDTIDLGREYTTMSFDGDTVFYFRGNKFYTLYTFNAVPGNMWIISGNNSSCPQEDTIRVDSIGFEIINSDTLRYLWTSKISNAYGLYFTGRITERIGCLGYMFPEPYCQIIDINEGGPFRCYNDSDGWQFSAGIVSSCDYTPAIGERPNQDAELFIFPNPFSHFAHLKIPDEFSNQIITFEIFDVHENVLIKEEVLNELVIDGSSLLNGVYFWKAYLREENNYLSGKFVKYY